MQGINVCGVYDAIGLIESIMVDLDHLEVKGVENMKIIFNTIGKLDALRKNLPKEQEVGLNGNAENGQG